MTGLGDRHHPEYAIDITGIRTKILFIDAVEEVSRERTMSFLKPAHINRVVDAYNSYVDEPQFSKIITLEEIAEHDFRLSISLYVKPLVSDGNSEEEKSLQELWDTWVEDSVEFWEEMDGLVIMLDGLLGENNCE